MVDRYQPRLGDEQMREDAEGEYVDWQDWLNEHNLRVVAERKLGAAEKERDALRARLADVSARFESRVESPFLGQLAAHDEIMRLRYRLDSLLNELHQHVWRTQTDGGFISEILARAENATVVERRIDNSDG